MDSAVGAVGSGVRQVDRRGRRWFTAQFKDEVVARCRRPGASVSAIALELGLNANVVRKWIIGRDRSEASVPLLPVRLAASSDGVGLRAQAITIRRDELIVEIGSQATALQIEAVLRALR